MYQQANELFDEDVRKNEGRRVCASEAMEQNLLKVLSKANKADGGFPQTVLVLDHAGNLYGTSSDGAHGTGVVFKITP